ncbi:hypothetical protein WA026_012224 [Henosepilachna vigintioctopunctata]|uniref:Major facilitator superfamily (MFS) profile domain-containing protein n=1 Tax=Henosepilachna vigintioctopunctata TaxID=420089 RepID=A0AAW1VB72_9CUCU
MSERYDYKEVALGEGSSKPHKTGFASSLMSVASLVSSKKFLYFAACIGNLASLTCGVASSWTSPEIPKFKENGTSLETLPTAEEESWIGSLLPVGAIIGPFFAGFGADKFGRKYTLLLGNVPFILAFLIACFAKSLLYIYVLRFLCGLGVGLTYTVYLFT